MSSSFWITLVVTVGSILYACFEHVEIRDEFSTAIGYERLKSGLKLFLLWAVPAGTLVATIWSAWESYESEKKSSAQVEEIRRQSNELVRIDGISKQQSNDLSATKSSLNQAKQELKKAGPRRLTDDEKRLAISLLQSIPKVQFNFGLNTQIEDSDGLFRDLVEVLAGAGFRFCEANWYTFSAGRFGGIMVSASSNPVVTDAILRSFNAVGLNAKSGTSSNRGYVTRADGGFNGNVPCDAGETIAIEIGYKW